jgi:hypothetical protein
MEVHIPISLHVFKKFCLFFKKLFVNVAQTFLFRIVDVLEGQGINGKMFPDCFSVSLEAAGIIFIYHLICIPNL